ncbi:EAL domain-containing protein [Shewanella sp. D64]|uniref:putative bifunctional diguanylate cyclase/phosphodiesterase n=1 Tax=unclassified Shewanella TaxID=196818 RepID=UPI0022BA39D5|nr:MULTISPECIES: EAL domain-containing protein [unclassified Shewanella]MEC4728316.1 EAL domain-containing protein [Shewanella sp. D64]MEC4740389.1 EAL domain-containing protein [Shewanella sp. E94]WBJ93313.1 EAL domain-containing protein [Shewanella sp. MTB7]
MEDRELIFLRRIDRERRARKQAEQILTEKSKELWNTNQKLQQINEQLDQMVKIRTSELEKAKINAELESQAHKNAKERFQLAMKATSAGVWEKNVIDDVWFFSERLIALFGYTKEELLIGLKNFSLIHNEDKKPLLRVLKNHLRNNKAFDFECRVLTREGRYKWFWIVGQAVWNDKGEVVRIAGSFSDIDERVENSKLVEKMAHYDHLTMVPNRVLYNQELDIAITHAENDGDNIAVILIDLNDFKQVNDTLGHCAGDHLLQHIANQFKLNLRDNDIVARLGGDEFSIVLTNIRRRQDVVNKCEQIIEAISRPFYYQTNQIIPKLSMGIAIYPEYGSNREELMINADLAMYKAKADKHIGSGFQFCEQEHINKNIEKTELSADLREAITKNEFFMYFQPIIDLLSGNIIFAEALIRWKHPQKGVLLPKKFISMAEGSGLIIQLGELSIELVAKQVERMVATKRLQKLTINISPIHFLSQDFIENLKKNLIKYPKVSDYIIIEITEAVFLINKEVAKNTIFELHNMGMSISLDDFGSSYSSFKYLQQLPIDVIKLDSSFIAELDVDPSYRTIASTIIELAHSLNIKVIAEGVDSNSQLVFLQDHHCDFAQGRYFFKPLSTIDFLHMQRNISRLPIN